tara:strand:+ start:939 stop:1226 length:288 start_codon:yes stop_codon:yes gene_type:complete
LGAKPNAFEVKKMNKPTITETMIKTNRAIVSYRNIAHISWKEDRKYNKEIGDDEMFYSVKIYSISGTDNVVRQILDKECFNSLLAKYTNWVSNNE